MLSITFVRHGNTDANQKRILQGQMGKCPIALARPVLDTSPPHRYDTE